MHHPLRAIGLSLLLSGGFHSQAWAEPPGKYMPKGPGVIDGRAAIVVLANRYDSVTQEPDYFDPAGLEAHLAPVDDPDAELAYPAGTWFQPPPGRYRVWLQGGWRMTPFSGLIIWGAPIAKSGLATGFQVEPAGRVKLPPETDTAANLDLHLLYAGSYLDAGFPRWELSPRKAAAKVGEGMLMPAGRAVGALWDRRSRSYVALSRPFEVRDHQTVEVPLERPRGAADLVVQLTRHPMAITAADLEVGLTLRQESGERRPDLAVFSTDRVYAFWYGLAPGPAELSGESRTALLESQRLNLEAGRIARLTAELKPRPALEVQLDLPSALRQGEPALEIRRLPLGEVLGHRILDPTAVSHRFEGLPPALLRVELQTRLGSFSRQVDLSSGQDGFLLLKPELIALTGTVYYGEKEHSAQLTFANAARETKVLSGGDGRYEALLLEPVQTVSIALDGVPGTPYFDFFRPAVALSKGLDFHLPHGDFRVKVLDAATGKGISDASVEIRNTYVPRQDAAAPDRKEKREKAVFQSTRTGETGEARLPPLRAGSIEIRAAAEGYARMREARKAPILDADEDQTFEVRLEPAGETVPLRLRLPSGAPAAGAQVLVMGSLAAGTELFSARAGEEGRVELPRKYSGFLLAKHPAAAFAVREWRPGEEDGEQEWA
nr:carboxypeptidase-like regulatory domain-containing protein [Acidobacteriota bacterium]